MKMFVLRVVAFIGMLALLFAAIFSIFDWRATDAYRHKAIIAGLDIYDSIGIDESGMSEVLDAVEAYLKDDSVDSLDIEMEIDGSIQRVFNDREIEHMRDVRQLFALGRRLRNVCAVVALASIVAVFIVLKVRRAAALLANCLLAALVAIVLVLGSFCVWLYFDFTSAFNFFHGVLFTNDLWQLNPATDRMIRMFPEKFFITLAGEIGISLIIIPAVVLTTFILGRRLRVKHG